MATSFPLISARSVLSARFVVSARSKKQRAGDLPSWPAIPVTSEPGSVLRLFHEKPKLAEELRPAVKLTGVTKSGAQAELSKQEIVKLREDLEVTDDIVSSESKLHALYLKWLSYFEHHFDVEDEKAFKERFEIFKKTARRVNQWNKGGHLSTCGLNQFSDMTDEEYGNRSWKVYPTKANQVIAGIAHYLDN